ncbi:electron transfer flavoprotein subunit beta/FixA family protein [Pengzhenrongella frigida]|uniref:Electron transfer flavoprotein subunit beta n=1 Tax=Pengzhenrongella frigida TaxID=1259133 RepID=A0A4Q5MUU1_9MICO|nr:electron transfer flavoprotein subunit beta/FixA family protein [Cellulomonas sp. HLT2-17]RYV49308.1 electron transfer flavoprotein beta subunit/FixA family protein [Cellulomonas sp. HLT2-17]
MRIVVCVKHVPDIQSERSLRSDGRVVRDGGDGTLNELDENAVEAALALLETHVDGGGTGEVIALTVGPDDAEDAVRRGLQMGADVAVHVLDDAIAGSDVFGTATVLAAAIKHLGATDPVDLVVTGMAALDGLTSMLPATLAYLLDLPMLTLAAEVTLDGPVLRVRREIDSVTEILTAPLPALVSVTDQANEPRYPNFKGIMAARKKPVTVLTLADLGVDPATVGTAGARTEVLEAAARPARENRILVTDDGTAGAQLAAYLVEHKLV